MASTFFSDTELKESNFADGYPPSFTEGVKKLHHLDQRDLAPHLFAEDYAEIVENEEADYANPNKDYEIDRSRIDLEEIVGYGQFGEVYRGSYQSSDGSGNSHMVAVKTCKVVEDDMMAEKFLEEACM